jgi:peroxiredoxin
MAQLRQDYEKLSGLDSEVVVVGPDNAQSFKSYWEAHKLPFIGLPDPTHSVLKLFGQQINLFKLGRMPAQVIIDKNGIARFVHYGKSMSDIPPSEELIMLLSRL